MDRDQIDVAIKKLNALSSSYSKDRILNDAYLRSEYEGFLAKMTWEDFADVYRDLQRNFRDLPAIADINGVYNRILSSKHETRMQQDCPLCNSSGWVSHKVVWNHNEYDRVARCICAAGEQYNYDFRKAEDPKMRSNKRVACIAEVFDIEKLKAERSAAK